MFEASEPQPISHLVLACESFWSKHKEGLAELRRLLRSFPQETLPTYLLHFAEVERLAWAQHLRERFGQWPCRTEDGQLTLHTDPGARVLPDDPGTDAEWTEAMIYFCLFDAASICIVAKVRQSPPEERAEAATEGFMGAIGMLPVLMLIHARKTPFDRIKVESAFFLAGLAKRETSTAVNRPLDRLVSQEASGSNVADSTALGELIAAPTFEVVFGKGATSPDIGKFLTAVRGKLVNKEDAAVPEQGKRTKRIAVDAFPDDRAPGDALALSAEEVFFREEAVREIGL